MQYSDKNHVLYQHMADTGFCSYNLPRRQDQMEYAMADQEQAEIRLSVARLRQEHTDFDLAINAMMQTGCNQLSIQRMKKKKLAIKDQLSKLEDKIIPDIIA